MNIKIPNNWEPRPRQLALARYLQKGGKRAVACWHRRFGKDDVALHMTAYQAMQRVGTYWHMLPEASQARKAIWNGMNPHSGKRRIDEAFPKEIRKRTNDQEMFIEFINGSTWQVVGSDNYNSLVGSPPIGVVFSEWSLANPLSWGYIRPILLENKGWALFIYTPRGNNHGKMLYESARSNPDWFCEKLTVDDTGIFTPEQLANELKELCAEHGESVGKSLFRQEYYCSFDAAILGAIYAEWIEKADAEGRIKPDLFDPELPVYTSWDLGYGDATAVWFYQLAYGEVRFIDYWEDTGKDVQACCEALYGRSIIVDSLDNATSAVTKWHHGEPNEFAHRQAYRYERHHQPHDAAYKLQTARGRSFAQQCYEYGVKSVVIQATNQETAVQATRKLFPQFWFDEKRCTQGINVLKNYQFDYDEDNKVFRKIPKHNWASHGAKSIEIVGRTNVNVVSEYPAPEKPRFLHETTADELFWGQNGNGVHHRERI